eukprot:CAMPEP_0194522028 /NCGR_PEP_ID=MMETSP0253-20130528/56482_1 /TAXON_ID=2966 /ORGANISM="Noctiluca scintillans" /LENGTH=343 /DNA_ID=CAMNT_0039366431 /DNA_START=120 /DNA_END=1151 /DNA_ORIENTATION=-
MTGKLAYEEFIGDGSQRIHGYLYDESENSWIASVGVLEAGESPWYGPSQGALPESVGEISLRLVCPRSLEVRIRQNGEAWQDSSFFNPAAEDVEEEEQSEIEDELPEVGELKKREGAVGIEVMNVGGESINVWLDVGSTMELLKGVVMEVWTIPTSCQILMRDGVVVLDDEKVRSESLQIIVSYPETYQCGDDVVRYSNQSFSEKLCCEQTWMLAQAVLQSPPRILNLNGNIIGNLGARALADILPECDRLEGLSLCRNRIGDVGVSALAKKLPHSSLSMLELWMNEIGDVGACALARAVRKSRLVYLYIPGNELTEKGKRALDIAWTTAQKPARGVSQGLWV